MLTPAHFTSCRINVFFRYIRYMNLTRLIFLFSLLFVWGAWGQKGADIRFISWDANEMGVKNIKQVAWDKQNRMWAFCNKGVVIYNGYSTSVLPLHSEDSSSILSQNIVQMVSDSNEIWFTYFDQRAITSYNFQDEAFRHFYLDTINGDIDSTVVLVNAKRDPKGRVWISSWGGGLIRLYEDENRFEPHTFQQPQDVSPRPSFVKNYSYFDNGNLFVSFFNEHQGFVNTPVIFNPDDGTYQKLAVLPLIQHIKDQDVRQSHRISSICLLYTSDAADD